jgi:DNA-binding SARP family transcriptional activator
VEFRILGPLEVAAGGTLLALGVPKQRALLAVLLLHANEAVSRERLIDELWGERPPARAAKLVQHYVSGLRKVLPADVLLTRTPGYLIRVEPGELDLHEFERLVQDARAATAEGDVARGADLYRRALKLWRGAALADVVLEGQAGREAAGLDDLRLAALIERMELELALGHHAEVVGELEALVERHPYQERLRGQLMLALYRSGRQTEALEAFHATRRLLVDELGLEPSQELQRLERAILQQEPSLELPRVPAQPAAPEPAVAPHRKTVTIVVGALTAPAWDPEAFGKALANAFAGLSAAVAYHGGRAERLAGGELMAVFGVPEAHEDDALRALRAAVQVRDALGNEVKIGIATGEVLADSIGVTGAAVGEATRLAAAAAPGEAVAAPATLALAGGAVESEGSRVLAVAEGRPEFPERTEAPLVGRRDELTRLHEFFESVLETQRCQVVTVFGEAGIGKTRLVRELLARLGTTPNVLVGRCVSYGEGATYLPLRDAFREVDVGAILADADADDAELVARRFAELTGEAEGAGSSGEGFWAVRRVLEALARERPAVLVLEDVHWAEPTFLDLVESLADWSVEAPVLALCLARPELLDTRAAWGGATSSLDALVLEPLSAEDSEALLAALDGSLAEDVRTRIAGIAEGNPLYVEQLAAFAEDAGEEALAAVPPTIDALLASRLDRLAAEERAVLERAAVVGREFAHAAVADLAPPEDAGSVGRQLLALTRRGLVRPARSRAASRDVFRFHHVLVRDVAYAGIPKEARAELHERHADWLERDEASDAIVGYHLEQAHALRTELGLADGRTRRLALAAGERLSAAGVRAWHVGDAPAGANLLGRAAALLPAGHPSRSYTLRQLGSAQWALGERETADAALAEAVEVAKAAGDRGAELGARLDVAYRKLFTDPHGRAEEVLQLSSQAIPVYETLGDERSLGWAWLAAAHVLGAWQGRYRDAENAAAEAVSHYRTSGWMPAMCVRDVAIIAYHGPTPVPAALERCAALMEGSDRGGAASILSYVSGLHAMRGSFAEARDQARDAKVMFEELSRVVGVWTTWSPVAAYVETLAGDLDAAAAILTESCLQLERLGGLGPLSTQAAQLASILCEQGRIDEAERWAEISRTATVSHDVSANVGWRTAQARLLADKGAVPEAEKLARNAAEIAEATDALNRRADVLIVLAEVLRLAGRRRDASQIVEDAIALYERKGNVAAAAIARQLL